MNRTCGRCGHFGPSATDFYSERNVCKSCVRARSAKWRRENHDRALEQKRRSGLRHRDVLRQRQTKRYREVRDEALAAYGGKCVCCGETQREFLAFDHVNNDGAAHRKTSKSTIVWWLRAHGYPSGFQILCHNCNSAKGFYGTCPHATRPTLVRSA